MYHTRLFALLSIAAVALGISTASAATDTLPGGAINVGSADYFTVLAKGDPGFTDNNITGPSFVTGNYGVGGQGKLSITGSSTIQGKLVMHSGGQLHLSGQASITGGVSTNDAQLNQALADAQMLSDAAAMEAVTPAYASLTNVTLNGNQSMTITGAPGQKVVLSLQSFSLNGNSTFTLQGTATTSFIINVAKNFSLTGNSQILLAGVPPQNVLFNIVGKGSDVHFSGKSGMSGILLALNRKVDLSGGHVTGKVIADQVVITSGGSVVTPTTNR
jgi:cytoskeletal protein CcmA (bactofilin family)